MSEHNAPPSPAPHGDGPLPDRQPAPSHSFWWKTWLVIKTVQARLRFILILVAVGLVIGYWDTLKSYYEKLTRPLRAEHAASSDTEFFCPMHLQIVRDKPAKCPLCNMPLAKRKKGDAQAEALPPGTVSRVQLTPYKIVAAGIQTWEVDYRPLVKEIQAVGFVEFDERKLAHIAARQKGRIEKLSANVTGQLVKEGEELAQLNIRYDADLRFTIQNLLDARQRGKSEDEKSARARLRFWDIGDEHIDEIIKAGRADVPLRITSPITGHIIRKHQVEGKYVEEGTPLYDVADLSTVWIQAQVYEDELAFLQVGQDAIATTDAFPSREFKRKLAFVDPHLDQTTRTLRIRLGLDNPDHELRPGMFARVKIQLPVTRLGMFSKAVTDDWVGTTAAGTLAQARFNPTGLPGTVGLQSLLHMALQRLTLRQGLVPAVPQSAVIDTGSRKIVYRQTIPGEYEGIEVELGPRSGGFYPVVRGLEAGERLVTNGSFLIDAETRLNPALGSTYFGASGATRSDRPSATAVRPSTPEDVDAKVKASLGQLDAADRRLASAQQFCPVLTDSLLGSMGRPVKVWVKGEPVFLCCKSCEKEALDNPDRTLSRVEKLKKSGKNR